MSGHQHDDHAIEQKPVSFTVPFFLAAAVIIITLLFLSLCDPKPHHAAMHGHGEASAAHHGAGHSNDEAVAPASTTEDEDSMTVESTVPSAEASKTVAAKAHEEHH